MAGELLQSELLVATAYLAARPRPPRREKAVQELSIITEAAEDADSLLDHEDASANQERVDLPQRRREQVHTSHDQRFTTSATREFGHTARQTDHGDESGSLN